MRTASDFFERACRRRAGSPPAAADACFTLSGAVPLCQTKIPCRYARCSYRRDSIQPRLLELLGERETLALIRRADAAPVELCRPLGQRLEEKPADCLAILDHEGHVVGADFEDRTRAAAAGFVMPETRIEEARVSARETRRPAYRTPPSQRRGPAEYAPILSTPRCKSRPGSGSRRRWRDARSAPRSQRDRSGRLGQGRSGRYGASPSSRRGHRRCQQDRTESGRPPAKPPRATSPSIRRRSACRRSSAPSE